MEQILDKILFELDMYISVSYLLIFMFLSYIFKDGLAMLFEKITYVEWRTRYTVLFIATLIGVLFLIFKEDSWVKILLTYGLGTTFHELIFAWIEEIIKKKVKKKKEKDEKNN